MMKQFFATVARNSISMVGSTLTTASALLFLTFFLLSLIGFEGGPYSGILVFVVLPGIFAFGLVLIPIGIAVERRRKGRPSAAADEDAPLPVIDLNVPRTRRLVVTFLALSAVNVVILALASYKSVEVMDSTEFCGETCHSVMAPEFTTYRRSPHSNVKCVSCHIGPGADWFVKSKLSGSWQLVAVTFNLYPRPIPTPVENLRPARETCEQCHWPSKFVGDKLKVISHYAEDEANSESKTVLLLRVGGVQGGVSRGIHWHVSPGNRIRYLADKTRELITEVELTRADGTVQLFKSQEAAAGDGSAESEPMEWRTMDCVDCHNRPTHIYYSPENELDRALADGRIARSLPFIRREGLSAILRDYESHEQAREEIHATIRTFYESEYPEIAASSDDLVETASRELANIYCTNVFPSMNIVWNTYPNHIGHAMFPGCFRCHDDAHTTEGGEAISQDCSTCHELLAMEEENPEILKELNP